MRFQPVGALDQLGQKVGWVAVVLFCLVFVPLASSQKTASTKKTPETAQQLKTAEEANNRIAQLALADAAKQGDYVIGSGDLLDIEVFGVPALSRQVRVNESGLFSLPLIPEKVHAAGLTPFQLQDKIAELLQTNGLVTSPQVTVSVKEQHSQPITVIGAVKKPTVIQAVRQMTLLEVLSEAGGLADNAGGQVLITRGDGGNGSAGPVQGSTIKINLNDLLSSGNPQYNIPILGGDVVSVPTAGVVYAVGAVEHAGGFELQNDQNRLTVLKVISLSGGLKPTAKPKDAVIIRTASSGQREQIPVNLKKILQLKAEDVALRENDILFVPDSSSKRALRKTAAVALSLATGVAIIQAGRY